uniref:Uncharacterized protein n=1 Tax=Sphaerodactylus townsendi TaxID=933632 RepID=A0ACB8EXL5_9SAUR
MNASRGNAMIRVEIRGTGGTGHEQSQRQLGQWKCHVCLKEQLVGRRRKHRSPSHRASSAARIQQAACTCPGMPPAQRSCSQASRQCDPRPQFSAPAGEGLAPNPPPAHPGRDPSAILASPPPATPLPSRGSGLPRRAREEGARRGDTSSNFAGNFLKRDGERKATERDSPFPKVGAGTPPARVAAQSLPPPHPCLGGLPSKARPSPLTSAQMRPPSRKRNRQQRKRRSESGRESFDSPADRKAAKGPEAPRQAGPSASSATGSPGAAAPTCRARCEAGDGCAPPIPLNFSSASLPRTSRFASHRLCEASRAGAGCGADDVSRGFRPEAVSTGLGGSSYSALSLPRVPRAEKNIVSRSPQKSLVVTGRDNP